MAAGQGNVGRAGSGTRSKPSWNSTAASTRPARIKRARQEQIAALGARAAHLEATLDQERRQAQEKLAVVNDAQEKLSDAFRALAAEALSSNNQSFLDLAKAALEKSHEVVKGDLDKRQTAISGIGHAGQGVAWTRWTKKFGRWRRFGRAHTKP